MNHHVHCGQVARDISFHPKTRRERFLALGHDDRIEVLNCLSKKTLRSLVQELKPAELVDILEHLDPDESADLVQLLPKGKQKKAIEGLNSLIQEQVAFLTEFDPQTAAGLMNLQYIQLDREDTIEDAARQLQAHERRTGRIPIMLVLGSGKLIGELPGHRLGIGSADDPISEHIRNVQTIPHAASRQEVLNKLKNQKQNKLVVLGREGNVLGIVFADSLLRYVDEQASQSLYSFAGIHKEESVLDPARTKVKFRYKWLILNLGTAFVAASIVGLFQETISKYVLLAVYMPIVAGMGGNSGTQTLAVLVRGITLGQIDLKTAKPVLKREVTAGLVNGVINGTIVATIVQIFTGQTLIALVLGMAMIITLIVSASFGTMVPLLMKRLGKDPATSATIFITTATDVLGFLSFLGLATWLLP